MSVQLVNENGGIEGFADRLFASLEKRLREVAKDEQASLEDHLSTPVERNFAGEVTRRSDVGEDPRKDEGQLVGNVESQVVQDGGKAIILAVGVSRPDTPWVPAELEYGTGHQKGERPFMRRAMQRAGEAVGIASQAVAEKQR
jgi:hypothetical protein